MVAYRNTPKNSPLLKIPDLSDLDAQISYLNDMAFFSLGNLVDNPDASDDAIFRQAHRVYIPKKLLHERFVNYHVNGRDQIVTSLPNNIPTEEFPLIFQRLDWLGELANPYLSIFNIQRGSEYVANRSGKSPRQCRRYIKRWLAGGPLALSKKWDPLKKFRRTSTNGKNSSSLIEDEDKLDIIKEIIHFKLGTTAGVKWQHQRTRIPKRTLWSWLHNYRNPSSPKLKGFKIYVDSAVVIICRGYLLTHPYQHLTRARKNLKRVLSNRGLEIPSYSQLRRIKRETITDKDLAFIHNRMKKFNSEFRVTGHMVYPGVVWFIDFTPLNKMILDERITTKNKQSRVDVANFVSAPSGFWLKTRVFFDRMTQYDVAENLIDLFITHGKPDQIWVDGAGELKGDTIKRLCEGLGIHHRISPSPQQNGKVEARNRYTNDNYSRESSSDYSGANLDERPEKITAKLHPNEVQRDLDKLLHDFNNTNSNTSDEDETPLELFERYDNTIPLTDDEILLVKRLGLKQESRQMQNHGIRVANAFFWFAEMGLVDVSAYVKIWYDPRYGPPDEIIVEMTDDACKYLNEKHEYDPNEPAKKIYLTARNKNVSPPSYQEHREATRNQTAYRKWRTKPDIASFEAANTQVEEKTSPEESTSTTTDPGSDISKIPEQLSFPDHNVTDDDDYQAILADGL